MAIPDNAEPILGSGVIMHLTVLVGRLLLGLPFPVFGVMKYRNLEGMSSYVESAGLPGEMIYVVIPFQILCGLAVWFGYKTRCAAFALAGFCILAASFYHNSLDDVGELAFFTKDYATAGGFLLLWKCGPGKYSLDAWLESRKQFS